MKIAIISDSHDNIPNIQKFLGWANKNEIEMIIHCGDIAAPSMISDLFAKEFKGEMHFVYGNVADRESLPKVVDKFDNITLHDDQGELEVDPPSHKASARFAARRARQVTTKIAFCHRPDEAMDLARSGKYHLVFHGHSHKPWTETVNLPDGPLRSVASEAGKCEVINPGTLGGVFYKAAFAVYDTASKNLELKVLEKL